MPREFDQPSRTVKRRNFHSAYKRNGNRAARRGVVRVRTKSRRMQLIADCPETRVPNLKSRASRRELCRPGMHRRAARRRRPRRTTAIRCPRRCARPKPWSRGPAARPGRPGRGHQAGVTSRQPAGPGRTAAGPDTRRQLHIGSRERLRGAGVLGLCRAIGGRLAGRAAACSTEERFSCSDRCRSRASSRWAASIRSSAFSLKRPAAEVVGSAAGQLAPRPPVRPASAQLRRRPRRETVVARRGSGEEHGPKLIKE